MVWCGLTQTRICTTRKDRVFTERQEGQVHDMTEAEAMKEGDRAAGKGQ